MASYIIENLIRLMKIAEQLEDLKTGKSKKQYVLNELKNVINLEPHIEYLIMEFIDLLIEVDKNKITINKKIKKGCYDFINIFN